MLKALKNIKEFSLCKYLLLFALFSFLPFATNAQVMNISDGATVFLNSNATVSVKGGMKISTGGQLTHSNSAASHLWFTGRLENYGTYTQNDFGIFRFFGNLPDTIAGNSIAFERLWLTKTGVSMVSLVPGTDITINKSLRLISSNIFNIHRSNLTFETNAMVYADSASNYTQDPLLDPFTPFKFIMTSGEKDLGGTIIRKLPIIGALTSDISLRFPIGTPLDTASPSVKIYTPGRIVLNAFEAYTTSNAFFSMRCIAAEHPNVEVSGVSLKKYWQTDYNNIFVNKGGYNVRFNYNDSEVQGDEEIYMLSLFYRKNDGINGTFYINAGAGYGVEPVNNRFYVDEVNQKDTISPARVLMDGDWTAGQQEAVSTFYYSIADGGNWKTAATWSKQGYGGAPATTYPTTINDKVFIGDNKTVNIAETTPDINSVRIQQTGRLAFVAHNSAVQSDSMFVDPGGTLAISSDDGITSSGMNGNVQSTNRVFSQFGIYEYFGDRKQVTGNGLPDIVGSLIINKTALADSLSLTKSVLVKDSLVINEGTFHTFKSGNFTVNGETGDTTARRIIMRGGEFSLQNFPTKYKNAIFDEGTITFDGTGSFRIPSSVPFGAAEPAVTQYHNLKLKGSRSSNTYVTLDPSGVIRINGNLDISGLQFNPTPITDRFIVTGSTVAFNGTALQDIQTGYASPTPLVYRLKFHDLNIEGSGNKNIMPPNDSDPDNNFVLVRNFLNLKSGTLVSNDHHIKVLNSWFTDPGALFNAGSGLVSFEADGKITNIRSSGIQFNDVLISGTAVNGIVNYLDSMTVGGNLLINPANFRDLNSTALSVRGNFTNLGIFTPQNGRVYFNGTAAVQTLLNNGKGNFRNITVNKPSGQVRIDGDSLIKITRNLTLTQGNIGGRNSVSVPNKALVVDSSITRTGATPGHVDGRLRLPTIEGANTKLFAVGIGNDYAPINMDIKGFGGAGGYLDAYILLDTDGPNITRTVIETQNPNGPELDSTKNVRKIWVMHADTSTSSRFQLGAARTYDAEFFFPASDVRNSANTSNFEIYHRDTTTNNGRWTRPNLDARNALSTKFINEADLDNNASHYFMLGEPKIFTYYSIATGDWSSPSTWSTAGYLSPEVALRAPIANDNVRIGNGKVVTLNVNYTTNANRLVVVETGDRTYENGHLIFNSDTRLITGAGTFRLDSGAAITIRHQNGISTTAGANGCVQTTVRQFNYNNHNSGNFIYGRNGNQATGNGFPSTVRTLKMDMPSGTLSFTGTSPVVLQVQDSLYLAKGNADLSTVIMKIAGNFVVDTGGSFSPGTTNIFGTQYSMEEMNRRDTAVWASVVVFNGSGEQWVRGTYDDGTNALLFHRLSMSKPSGIVKSIFNIQTTVLWFKYPNRANIDVANNNKFINVYHPTATYALGRRDVWVTAANNAAMSDPIYGYVVGRLIRYFKVDENQRYFPIGTGTKYSPLIISREALGANTGQVAGLIEVQAINGNHPNFNSANINQNTNIQRYYEITRPVDANGVLMTPTFTLGNRALSAQMFFTLDEPRGGINALNYLAYRLVSGNTWSRSTNISTTNVSSTDLTANPNYPTLGGNNIFSVPSQFTATNAIVLMIGEDPNTLDRVFYSRNSGAWTDPNTWSYSPTLFEDTETGYALNSNTVNDYPKRNNGVSKDFAIVGNGHTVTFDTNAIDLQYVLVEKSIGGMGHLIMPNETYFRTNQFVQKNGGKLSIGSRYGITNNTVANASTAGNIKRLTDVAIINYDWNDKGINNFEYIGASTDNVQNTGDGLPNTVASLGIDYSRSAANRYVELTNDANLTIKDSIVFKNGRFRNRGGNKTLTVLGDIVNNSTDAGFHNGTNPSNRRLYLTDTLSQAIRGTATETAFPMPLRIDKSIRNITTTNNIRFSDSVQFRSNTIFGLSDGITATFGTAAIIDSLQTFKESRLFKVSGGTSTAKVRKEYPVGTSTQTFTFPIGEDSTGLRPIRYSEARFTLTNQVYSAGNYLEIALRSLYPHPNAPSGTPNMLGKYWSVSTNNIDLGAGTTSARFKYNDLAVRGNILNYRPALYRRADVEANDPGWSFELFNASNLQIDTLNKFIIVDNAVTLPNHDWTSGDPESFAKGRIFWSRANGDWSNPNIWTNFNNAGNPHTSTVPALNSPGFFAGDTVIVGNSHLVYYDKPARNSIDSLGVGVALSTAPELRFLSTSSTSKSLKVSGNVGIGSTGLISKDNASGNSVDTLFVTKNFINQGGAGRGVDFYPNAARNLRLEFIGNKSSYLQGEGNYKSIGTVRLFKADSSFNLFNESQSFSASFTTALLTNSVKFQLDAGMYYHDNAANITLSKDGDGDVFLGDLVGVVVRNGNVTYSDGLICGQNASVWLINGNMTIGNIKDENFQYESTTIIDIQGGSKLLVAGTMRRRFLTSAVNFRLRDNAQIEVMRKGATTNSAERRAAFDFGEANSQFTMTGGKVIIYRPMELSVASEKDPDYYVNTTVSTVTGGTVQFGHVDSTVAGAQPFNLIASTPFWNLDLSNTYSMDLFLSSPIINVRNDLTVRDLAIMNQNGNILNIGGDFTLDGLYKTGTVGSRRLSFFGDSAASPATKLIQNVKIKGAGNDALNDLVISKPNGGSVNLSNDPAYPNSNFVVRNTLEFSISNKALINTGSGRYVQVGTNQSDLASIQRFGLGHVNGELRRWINDGSQSKSYPVGTAADYTPADVLTGTGSGTPGLLSVTAYGIAHPDLASSALHQPGTSINRYWRIVPAGTTPFAIGATRDYSLNLFFKKGLEPAGDQRIGSSFGTYEHFRRTAALPAAGTWYLTTPEARTDSSTSSKFNAEFGDFVIAEIAGARFYSRQTGNWNDVNTWSVAGYDGAAFGRIPNIETDRVFIGKGRTITINNFNPRIRSVTVEVNSGLPGKLVILDERYLRGLSFELNDSCHIATDDAFGFTNVSGPTPNIGAVRTTSIRSFGKGIYEYLGSLSQAMGDGPTNPKTLIVNNQGTLNKTVSFSTVNYQVEDSIYVQKGILSMGNSNVLLKGNLVSDLNSKVQQGVSRLSLIGTSDQYFVMNDSSGINLYNLSMIKPSGNLILKGLDSAALNIQRNLTFALGNVGNINARQFGKRVVLMADTSTVARLGTGHVDGLLFRPFGTSVESFVYPIGFSNIYAPAELTLSAGTGTAGYVSGIVNSPPVVGVSRIDPVHKINYYWDLAPYESFALGSRKANTKFTFPAGEVANLTGGVPNNAILLRKTNPIETPLWKQRQFAELNWNIGTASVEIANPANYWNGLGEFYIGERYRLIFYSLRDGVWNDYRSWALNEARTILAPEGEYPNPSSDDLRDSVIIGKNDEKHKIELNVASSILSGLTLRYNGNLDMHNSGAMLGNTITSSGKFSLLDSSIISFGGLVNPTTTVLAGFNQYIVGANSNIEFYGTQTITPSPFGLSRYDGNVIISNLGTKIADVPTLILGNLFVESGATLDIQAMDALSVRKSVINRANIINNGVLEIGQ